MRITVLMENTCRREDLAGEHGLSLLIETAEKTILFDAGQSGAFADNAVKLGIDLKNVDFAVLSHGHYDHGGGLLRFLEENETAPVFARPDAFGQYVHGPDKYIGLPPALRCSDRFVFNPDTVELAPGITLLACDGWEAADPMPCSGLEVLRDGVPVPDDFRHEHYLLIQEREKRIVFSGCSHRGITNICRWLRPDALVGGFHFVKLDPHGAELEAAASAQLTFTAAYYTGHCTGEAQFAVLKSIMGERLYSFSTGDVIMI